LFAPHVREIFKGFQMDAVEINWAGKGQNGRELAFVNKERATSNEMALSFQLTLLKVN